MPFSSSRMPSVNLPLTPPAPSTKNAPEWQASRMRTRLDARRSSNARFSSAFDRPVRSRSFLSASCGSRHRVPLFERSPWPEK